ncbi:MAG: hypothetical protein ACREUM_03245, partial [Nitrosospira sp.]
FDSGDLNESRTAYKQFDGTVANWIDPGIFREILTALLQSCFVYVRRLGSVIPVTVVDLRPFSFNGDDHKTF